MIRLSIRRKIMGIAVVLIVLMIITAILSMVLVIQVGEVQVELPERTVTRGPGDFVGEIALLTDRPRTARVRARTAVRCWALGRKDFARLLEDHPRIAVRMLPALADKLADAP